MSPNFCSSGTAPEPQWLSAHVYGEEPFRDLLIGGVAPLAAEMREQQLAQRFFFIRYWEGGPHVRLRFCTDAASQLAAAVERHVELWRARFGSDYRLAYVPYEPEVERYGGDAAIDLAETVFDLSSRVALDALASIRDDDGVRGAVMLLHVGLAHAAGMTRIEAASFFNHPSRSLFSEIAPPPQMVQLCAELWQALDDDSGVEPMWLQQWIDGTRDAVHRLTALSLPPARMQSILASHVHMMNNRLGVVAVDELLVAYLTARTLESAS